MKISLFSSFFWGNETAQSGNVLFLILIAVALFAALSYSVTSSTRSGSGDSSGEKNLISSAQITQYPASVRTAILRMTVGKSIPVELLSFNPPDEFSDELDDIQLERQNVFHPNGGGAIYAIPPVDVMEDAATRKWVFNSSYEVPGIGNTTGTIETTETIAFLPRIKKSICERIHKQLALGDIPTVNGLVLPPTTQQNAGATASTPTINVYLGSLTDAGGILLGQPQGCFRTPASTIYYYYQVLVER